MEQGSGEYEPGTYAIKIVPSITHIFHFVSRFAKFHAKNARANFSSAHRENDEWKFLAMIHAIPRML